MRSSRRFETVCYWNLWRRLSQAFVWKLESVTPLVAGFVTYDCRLGADFKTGVICMCMCTSHISDFNTFSHRQKNE